MSKTKWLKSCAATVAALILCTTPVIGESAKAEPDKPIVLKTTGQTAKLFNGVKLPHDGYTINQFMRQQTCDTGELPLTDEIAFAVVEVDKQTIAGSVTPKIDLAQSLKKFVKLFAITAGNSSQSMSGRVLVLENVTKALYTIPLPLVRALSVILICVS